MLSLALPLPVSQVIATNPLAFHDLPSPHPSAFHGPPVVVHDCVEPVGNGQYSAVFKLGTDGALDEVVSLQVNGSSGLV